MSHSLEEEDVLFEDEWAEISDIQGRKALFRHLATIHCEEKIYHVLGAIREDHPNQQALMLIREEETADGALQHVIVNSEREIEYIVGQFVARILEQHMDEASAFEEEETMSDLQDACGYFHKAGEFCYCDDPAYLQ